MVIRSQLPCNLQILINFAEKPSITEKKDSQLKNLLWLCLLLFKMQCLFNKLFLERLFTEH